VLIGAEPDHGWASVIPAHLLAQLHRSLPDSFDDLPLDLDRLARVKFPAVQAATTEPLFKGTIHFVQINFTVQTPPGNFAVPTADIETAVAYTAKAAAILSAYASEYGANELAVSQTVLVHDVTLASATYGENDVHTWVNTVKTANNLPAGTCIAILNPTGVTNSAANPAQGVLGYHGKSEVPFVFVNVSGTNLTVDDANGFYAMALSHEIAEMTVDPSVDGANPEVCDPCAGNCNNQHLAFFDNDGRHLGFATSLSPEFAYAFFTSTIAKPASVTACPAPESDCDYAPPGLSWLVGLYADLLGRDPDAGGLAYWLGRLGAGESRTAVASGFLQSTEYCTAVITGLYEQLLGREPDPGGLANWVNVMERPAPLQDITRGFCNSTEYRNDNPVPDQFVESLYQRLLGRASDPGGKQYWVEALNAGRGTEFVIEQFLASTEYCTDRVTKLYQSLLGRTPDPNGLGYWVNEMVARTPFQQIQNGFLTSVEYQSRAEQRFP
jgi:hypothetical protein